MRNFTAVAPQLWQSRRFAGLPTAEAKLLHLYILTGPHANSGGCYRLPAGYACTDLGWSTEIFEAALTALVSAGLIRHDEANEVLLIEDWFRFCPPQNSNHLKGTLKVLEAVPGALPQLTMEQAQAAWNARQGHKAGEKFGATNGLELTETNYLQRRA